MREKKPIVFQVLYVPGQESLFVLFSVGTEDSTCTVPLCLFYVQGNDASDLQSALESVLPWPLLTALFQSSFVCKVQSTRMGFAKNGLTHFQFWTERHSFGPVSRPRRIWMGSQAFPGHHPLCMVGVKVRLNPRAVKTG